MDADYWIERLLNEQECLPEPSLKELCKLVKELLIEDNNVQPVSTPVVICGDIHGQFYDLLRLFEIGGPAESTQYVFLGDFVDRGYNSVETFELLMLLKLRYPQNVTLLRGNHESRQITQVYGFYDECLRKYGNANAWKYCTEIFDYLTLAALVDNRIFCVHGGLSPDIRLLDQVRLIQRVQEIPHEGAFGDLVWSDPEDIETWAMNTRGAGWLFGVKPAAHFLHLNDLDLIARAHQLVQEGYKYAFTTPECREWEGKRVGFEDHSEEEATGLVVTVWSAPNYCYRCGNVAAILRVGEDMHREHRIFESVPRSAESIPPRQVMPYFV